MFGDAFYGKRVWLSGHTGFKGSWMAAWLLELGAEVRGYALAPDTNPSLFDQLDLASRLEHEVADIRQASAVQQSIQKFRPDIVIHMAAQPLVRRSYVIPVETYEINIMGTVYVLEALRALSQPCAVVIVTSDKCYQNHDSGRAYEESDPLGGHDPYSSSKAMAEIAAAAYRSSYFQEHSIRVATARAGNVIGGGDWAEDRIIPDAMRALDQGIPIPVRNPRSVRPWQHVLEPLSGYLSLAIHLAKDPLCATSFNFGPAAESARTVKDLVLEVLKTRHGTWVDAERPGNPREAKLLNLSIEKANRMLGWKPRWKFEESVSQTSSWYDQIKKGACSPSEMVRRQIANYGS